MRIARALVPPLAALCALPALAGPLSATAEREIAHLLAHLENSGCEFFRNGDWHDARAARAHLEKKNAYLVDRSLVRTAEEFIARAATGSSMSGDPYQVRCPSRPVTPSADWLGAELRRYRARRSPSR